ncbi:MAG: N-acetylmuramoyl-L-alanine amidase family protein [Candidatus Xenobium sp.]|jgi:N-acetylmuramoyl-L-alanine amidase|nr:N-acetylmuramoyl-L-alanine amidase [Burkholderiales bacterium]
MRVFQVFLVTILLGVTLHAASAAETEAQVVELLGQVYRPQVLHSEGRTGWSLADPEVLRLVGQTTTRMSWSSDGETLYFSGSVRESQWKPGSPQVRVDGSERPAPGRLLGKGKGAWMEPEALFFALALKPQNRGDRVVAMPEVPAPRLEVVAGRRALRIPLASALRVQPTRLRLDTLRLRFPGCVWSGSPQTMLIDDVQVAISEREGAVLMDLRFPPNWQGEIRSGRGLTEVLVGWRASFPPPCTIREVTGLGFSAEASGIRVQAEGPFEYHWHFDRSTRRLTVDMPGLREPASLPVSRAPQGGWESFQFRPVGTSEQPILRFEGDLAAGHGWQFVEEESTPGLLFCRSTSTGQVGSLAQTGSAATAGYVSSRGLIVLDPGHGGGDPGCVNRSLGLLEKDITLDVALRLRDLLLEEGWTVLLTREDDRDVSWRGSPDRVELQARCDVANQSGADYFISLHCNASVASTRAGSSIHWFKQADLELARSLEFALGESLGLGQGGLRHDGFYVLRHTDMPAVLVEMAFLSNPREGSLLGNAGFRQRIAQSLAGALQEYVSGCYARGADLPGNAPR